MTHDRSLGDVLQHAYRGSRFGWIFLVAMGVLNLGRGSIHLFAEDGGAGRIAGIDLREGGEVIVMLFAGMGLTQLLTGVVDLSVGLRFRALTPLLVGFHLVQQIGAAWIVWLYKPLSVPAPGKYGALVLIPVAALALWASLRQPQPFDPGRRVESLRGTV